jgi:hypothetical protein
LRRQIEAGREFRQWVEAYWDACEHGADAELEQTEAAEAGQRLIASSASPAVGIFGINQIDEEEELCQSKVHVISYRK